MTPIENIKILQGQIYNILQKYKDLEKMLHEYDNEDLTFKNIEAIEKLENELEFMNRYRKNLEDQITVIMNEYDVIIS
jgi:DNA-binding transcriptional regulator GbsR (MarR family)